MTITNQTNNQYTFGPYSLPAGIGTDRSGHDRHNNERIFVPDG